LIALRDARRVFDCIEPAVDIVVGVLDIERIPATAAAAATTPRANGVRADHVMSIVVRAARIRIIVG